MLLRTSSARPLTAPWFQGVCSSACMTQGRPARRELSRHVSDLRAEIDRRLESGERSEAVSWLVEEAASSKETDSARRALVMMRNKADGLVYSTERTLEEFGENIDEDEQQSIKVALETTRQAMKAEDLEALREAVDELSGLTYQMTERLYAVLGGESE